MFRAVDKLFKEDDIKIGSIGIKLRIIGGKEAHMNFKLPLDEKAKYLMVSHKNKAFESTKINIQEGDILLELEGKPIKTDFILIQEILNNFINQTVKLKVWRMEPKELMVSVLNANSERTRMIVEWNNALF